LLVLNIFFSISSFVSLVGARNFDWLTLPAVPNDPHSAVLLMHIDIRTSPDHDRHLKRQLSLWSRAFRSSAQYGSRVWSKLLIPFRVRPRSHADFPQGKTGLPRVPVPALPLAWDKTPGGSLGLPPLQVSYRWNLLIGVPAGVPISSPETTNSTLRFCCRPEAVSLVATG